MKPAQPIVLHGFKKSGHSHRAELMLRLLDLPFTFHGVDLPGGAHKSEDFVKMNVFGQVPVIEDGDTVIADSVAILVYLATRYDPDRVWLPTDPVVAADIQRWLSIAQGPASYGPGFARLVTVFGADLDHTQAVAAAEKLFATLERHLTGRSHVVGQGPTIADVALYTYIAHAPEGGISLEPYPAIRGWLRGVEALPGFDPMPASTPLRQVAA